MKINASLFWAKVRKGGGCWEWIGSRQRNGYGRIRIDWKVYNTHRISWQLNVGTIPKGLHVLHRCDNPSCVRPGHLFLGTQADNNKDRDLKGRHRPMFGDENPATKLSAEDVRAIRFMATLEGFSNKRLGRMFNVSATAIYLILKGVNHFHVA